MCDEMGNATFYYACDCDYRDLAELRGEIDAYEDSRYLGPYVNTTEEIEAASFSIAFGMVYGEPINDHVKFDTEVPSKESLKTVYVWLRDFDQNNTLCFKRCWVIEEGEFRGVKIYRVLLDDESSGWYTEDHVAGAVLHPISTDDYDNCALIY